MFNLVYSNQFKKDIILLKKRGYNIELIKKIIIDLEAEGYLDQDFKPHKLIGKLSGYWEAHVKPDWLIIWKKIEIDNEIRLIRTGTHSDLF